MERPKSAGISEQLARAEAALTRISAAELLHSLDVAALDSNELRDLNAALLASTTAVANEHQKRASERATEHECVCCLDAPRSVIFLPCRHRCVCARCSPSCAACPLCRTAISDKLGVIG